MDIAIFQTNSRADRQKVRETIARSGLTVIPTIDRSLLPPKIVAYGEEDQLLRLFEKLAEYPTKDVSNIAHIRGINSKTIGALTSQRMSTRCEYTGIFETIGIQATIAALNAAMEVQGVEASEVQLAGGNGMKSLFVLCGRKTAVENALTIAKSISLATHIHMKDISTIEGKGS